jgi:peptidoglycan/LPS O-acetylase OafA/YrhL
MTNYENTKTIYLPGLNGLRAISALAVVISHTTLALDEFGLKNQIFGTDIQGNENSLSLAIHGVTIFFTLSGFLITYLSLKEKEKGKLKIKEFYIRRILRILPLYYLYLAISLLTMFCFGLSPNKIYITFYLFLAANIPFILENAQPFLLHYWSLGVEEQFYLFFPQIAKLSNKRFFQISITLIFILLSLKLAFWLLDKRYDMRIPYIAISVTRFHTMLIGVVAAILYYYNNSRFFAISTHKITQIVSWTVILLLGLNKFHLASIIDGEIVSIVTVFLIMGQITKRNNLINLENAVCDFIGKISYGIYVIHPLLIFYFAKLIGHFKSDTFANYLLVYSLILLTTILIAYLSYEFYEKRFLKLKSKYSTVKSANTKHSR